MSCACWRCTKRREAQRKASNAHAELDRIDQLLEDHARHIDRLRQRRRAALQRARAYEAMATDHAGCTNRDPEQAALPNGGAQP